MMGWIKIDRDIFDCFLWQEKPFSYGQAWVDLLLLANYEDKKTIYKGEVITCKRGDVNFSISYLANRWGWSRKKAKNFINILESDEMVATKVSTHRTTITIVNYGKFQNLGTTKDTTKVSTMVSTEEQQRNTIKNIKNIKNIRRSFDFEQRDYDFEEIERSMLSN